MKKILLANGNIVTDKEIVRCGIVLHNGLISLDKGDIQCDETIDITGKYVVPGFTDIHFHGYKLFDSTYGYFNAAEKSFDSSEKAFQKGMAMLSELLPRFGVTSFYLATVAAPMECLKRACGQMRRFTEQAAAGAKFEGVFLEGTFINPNMCGAQNPQYILEPSVSVFRSLEEENIIKLVNVVPETSSNAIELIRYLTDRQIICGCGHTAATGNQIDTAIKAGLKYFVHFLNGPTGHNYKPFDGGGAVEAVLRNESLYVEQIYDGWHIAPSYIRDVINRKGVGRVIGVTDALYAAGTDLTRFDLAGIAAEKSDKGDYIAIVGKPNALCSSMLTMDKGFENLLNWLSSDMVGVWNKTHNSYPFDEALIAASKICSTNPNELVGRAGYGVIADNCKADVCIIDIARQSGNYRVMVEKTFVGGVQVYSKN